MEELMIKIENVSKKYRLGAIGGGTLQRDLQSWWAKKRGKDDPNKRIGAKTYDKNEEFMALENITFNVKKGERIGIIGHNGAGKSTLLKLLSRVTAPTSGEIGLNGRVASMLEVGTGFHGELTGRENVYMNGAILGMNKKEIDAKMEDIIEFSECRQFIDTPVKRYSSGMFVKLAFSVAAHLDSEIMIMDEVLAVGDMAFQKKCLDKMSDVSRSKGRTILYVSHNMNTIRQLCDRCIVLDHGHVVYDGDVEEAIALYMGKIKTDMGVEIDLSHDRMEHLPKEYVAKIVKLYLLDKQIPVYEVGEKIVIKILINNIVRVTRPSIRIEVRAKDGSSVGTSFTSDITCIREEGLHAVTLMFNPSFLVPGDYHVCLVLYSAHDQGQFEDLDAILPAFAFKIVDSKGTIGIKWDKRDWGLINMGALGVLEDEYDS